MFEKLGKNNLQCFRLLLIAFVLGSPISSLGASENMALINAGGFMRGIDEDTGSKNIKPSSTINLKNRFPTKGFQDESPARMIYLSAYYIDKYEVSNADYIEFIKATDYPAPAYWDHHKLNKPTYPVTGVNWYDANAYCHWTNKRLPTEAEWEKAARGPSGSIYPWGNNLDYKKANFAIGKSGSNEITAPVNSYPEGKSYYGVYNQAGNVFEWVQDWYDPNYYKTSKKTRNPQGPQLAIEMGKTGTFEGKFVTGKKKVIRGGSWFVPAQSITTTHRFWNDPINNSYGVGLGFRCARDKEIDSKLHARTFFMNALTNVGAEKYKQAKDSIQKAIKEDPNNQEYRNLLKSIEENL